LDNTNYFEKIKSGSITDAIIKYLTDAIVNRVLTPGDRIPTEIELAEMFGVGRNSVREAVKVLVSYGILEIRRAEGTFVCKEFKSKMLNPLLYGIILEQHSYRDLYDLRRILELGSTQIAIQQATDKDIQRIKKRLDKLKETLEKDKDMLVVEDILRADVDFHRAVDEATHNPLLLKVDEVVNTLIQQSRVNSIKTLIITNQTQYLIDTHVAIYNLISNRDMKSVYDVIDESIRCWSVVLENGELVTLD